MMFLFIWCLPEDCCIMFSIKPFLLTLHLLSDQHCSLSMTCLLDPHTSQKDEIISFFQQNLPVFQQFAFLSRKHKQTCGNSCSNSQRWACFSQKSQFAVSDFILTPSICSFSQSSNDDFLVPRLHATVQSQSFRFNASCQHFKVCVCTNAANKFTERGHFVKASVPR